MARIARGTGLHVRDCLSLRQWREEHLLSPQSEVAERMRRRGREYRTNQGTVSHVENGGMPEPWTLDDWAAAYDLNVRDFVRLVRNVNKPVEVTGEIVGELLHTRQMPTRLTRIFNDMFSRRVTP